MKKLLALVALLLVAGCAEPPPQPPETAELDPAKASQARAALEDTPKPKPGWRIGVITSEEKREQVGLLWRSWVWSIAVLDQAGNVNVLSDGYCEADDQYASQVLPVMLAPGDLITWTGDAELCLGEVRVVKKAAA